MDPYHDQLARLALRLERIKGSVDGTELIRENPSQVVRILVYVEQHIEEIIPAIHDLWSEHLFTRGIDHPLLKPYAEMTVPEASIERALAISDMRNIRRAMCQSCSDLLPAPVVLSRTDLQVDIKGAQRTVFALAEDDQFVRTIAPLVHGEWRRIKRAAGLRDDVRLYLDFEGMSPEQQHITLTNVQHDIQAIAIFVERLYS